MLRSMTGFGAAAGEHEGVSIAVEVRSVNHRHLHVKTRVPSELARLEAEVEKLLRRKLERGSVTVHVDLAQAGPAQAARIDGEVAAGYVAQVHRLAATFGIGGTLSLDVLLGLPGVVDTRANGRAGPEVEDEAVLRVVKQALAAMIAMREAEGSALEAELRRHVEAILRLAERIERRMPRVVREHQTALGRRLEELLAGRGTRLAPADLAREVALLADRLDVSEELARAKSHLAQLVSFLERGGRIGRKLDFLVQELFRELNTIGSKCSDAKVAHWVVDAKTHAERLREQVQNVE
jgi:uncharacterized protein (TIGR00255 family)